MADDDYQFDDLDQELGINVELKPDNVELKAEAKEDTAPPTSSSGAGYATELYTKQIKAKFRTFYVDLKESSNGKFVKISEKSHGRKSTIMMDAEDIPLFIDTLQEITAQL